MKHCKVEDCGAFGYENRKQRVKAVFTTLSTRITQMSVSAVIRVMLLSTPSGTSKECRVQVGEREGGEHFEAAEQQGKTNCGPKLRH